MLRRLICFWGRLQRSILLASFGSKRSIDTRHSKALLQSEDQRLQRDINLGATSLAFFDIRSEEHTSELQSLMRISYAVFCLKKKNIINLYNRTLATNTHL